MHNLPLSSAKIEASFSLGDLERYADGWLLSGEISQHSPQTLALRRLIIKNLLWFLRDRECAACCASGPFSCRGLGGTYPDDTAAVTFAFRLLSHEVLTLGEACVDTLVRTMIQAVVDLEGDVRVQCDGEHE